MKYTEIAIRGKVQILPDPIRSALRTIENGSLAVVVHEGQVHVLFKAPGAALRCLRFPPPLRHFLFYAPMPTAPVVGWFFEIQDEDPLRLTALFNVQDPMHREILAQLPYQREVPFHIVEGEKLTLADSTRIYPPFNASRIYAGALACAAGIGSDRYDYDAARARFETDYPKEKVATWLPDCG